MDTYLGNRLHLYYKIATDEEEPEEFELLHDGGYDLPYDVPGFKTGKFDFYQRVKKDKSRIRKPKQHKLMIKRIHQMKQSLL